ncbi:hypothetical protein [Planctomycetes bacterium K23_9]|uniref:Uncharacterized protein n=1 Tax=Stieleria marina TaxID=1930275 RepID=A0A517NZC5_9BACT|nr:hypothetical protein K239x_44820 [Planctomycetes bacterium K23_9]
MSLRFVITCILAFASTMSLPAQDDADLAPAKPAAVPIQWAPNKFAPVGNQLPVPANFIAAPGAVFRQNNSSVNLAKLVRAKIDHAEGDEARLILMLESFRAGKGDKVVTEVVPEERTRTVVVDGKPVEQKFTVHKLVTKVERDADISVPAGLKPKTFSAKKFDFYDLAGNALSIDDAAKRISKLTPVFLLDNHNGPLRPLSDISQQAMNKNCLIVATSQQVRPQSNTQMPVWRAAMQPLAAPAMPVPVMPVPAPVE